MENHYEAEFGTVSDIDSWMRLVQKVSWNFPGLETAQEIEEHRQTVLKFMKDKRALRVKHGVTVAGVLLFSKKQNMICCLAVDPEHRRKRIVSVLLKKALEQLDRERDITVSTFRENDAKGIAPRNLYRKFGFVEDALTVEFGYPNQILIRHRVLPGN